MIQLTILSENQWMRPMGIHMRWLPARAVTFNRGDEA